MAMIKCPECGRKISDKAEICINCGCPLIKNLNIENNEQAFESIANEPVLIVWKSKKKKLILFGISSLLLIACAIGAIYFMRVVKPLQTYNEAFELLEAGKYEEANQIFNTIPEYKDVTTLQEQLKYESMVYECISSVKQSLKNPDSLQIHEVQFYDDKEYHENKKIAGETKIPAPEEKPYCIIRFGAQNGFGGNTTAYGLFMCSDSDKKYTYAGSCDTLNLSEIDDDDTVGYLICKLISAILKEDVKIGSVDINRIKNILKDGAYSTIKVIK